MDPQPIGKVVFVRHAESVMNTLPHIIGGRSNETPLTERGHAQAAEAATKLAAMSTNVVRVVCSPAVRTIATASYFSNLIDVRVIEEDRIQELDQRSLTGRRP
jgi:broad specificity phosphatase PhoE